MSDQVQIHMRLSKKTVQKIDFIRRQYEIPRIAMLKILLNEAIKNRDPDFPAFLGGKETADHGTPKT